MAHDSSVVFSGIPKDAALSKPSRSTVSLIESIELLIEHLTPALCEAVFRKVRKTERERKWTFSAIAQFWAAVIVRHPPSIGHGLAEVSKRRREDDLWPHVMAEPQAFFQKCAALRPKFFQTLFEDFTASVRPLAKPVYARWMHDLRRHFPCVQVIDGSKLDAIRHRLKILWPIRFPVLPGSLMMTYDLFTGLADQAEFHSHAHTNERLRAPDLLGRIKPSTLVLGDRLYCLIKSFHELAEVKAYGLFRRNALIKFRVLKILSQVRFERGMCEDLLIEAGRGDKQPKAQLRLIRYRNGKYSLDLMTNVLDPDKLPAQTAVKLYGMRWTIERMFLDLKKTLKLHCLYASHPNIVAQQFYAAVIVYNAFRIAQGRLAASAGLLPEQLSSEKLFPKLAQAFGDFAFASWQAIRIRELNPGTAIQFPDLQEMPSATVRLASIFAQRRTGLQRPPPTGGRTSRVRSFGHIRGGAAILLAASDG